MNLKMRTLIIRYLRILKFMGRNARKAVPGKSHTGFGLVARPMKPWPVYGASA
jgi:hypothetical protein